MGHFTSSILICYCVTLLSFEGASSLRCRINGPQSDAQLQKIMQVCRRRYMGSYNNDRDTANLRVTDSQESSDSDSDESSMSDNRYPMQSGRMAGRRNDRMSGGGGGGDSSSRSGSMYNNAGGSRYGSYNNNNNNNNNNGRMNNNYNRSSYDDQSGYSSRRYRSADFAEYRSDGGYSSGSTRYPSGSLNRGSSSNRYNNNNGYNNNNNNNYNNNNNGYGNGNSNDDDDDNDRAVDQRGFPERSAVINIMIQNIADPELRDFIEETVHECYHFINNNGRQEKCQFSQNLLTCLAEKGSERCEDWDDA